MPFPASPAVWHVHGTSTDIPPAGISAAMSVAKYISPSDTRVPSGMAVTDGCAADSVNRTVTVAGTAGFLLTPRSAPKLSKNPL